MPAIVARHFRRLQADGSTSAADNGTHHFHGPMSHTARDASRGVISMVWISFTLTRVTVHLDMITVDQTGQLWHALLCNVGADGTFGFAIALLTWGQMDDRWTPGKSWR